MSPPSITGVIIMSSLGARFRNASGPPKEILYDCSICQIESPFDAFYRVYQYMCLTFICYCHLLVHTYTLILVPSYPTPPRVANVKEVPKSSITPVSSASTYQSQLSSGVSSAVQGVGPKEAESPQMLKRPNRASTPCFLLAQHASHSPSC